ncbi:hypothetical protein GJ700_06185 [Duganella sp. FT92W]|uniref:TonB-dependent receptor n=1 Tax=Pseudoduganella rivuli TaxID=2666085 RepID=A0A7X2IKC2_9BURK|nr:hypothetical protein [Pseudoduganella rivuli]MRV71308.1 hypothetical protein [Pseudoduganella rivuli]
MRGMLPGKSIVAVALGAGVAATGAQGAGPLEAGPAAAASVPVVVVSARKRDETIIDAPLAITVFSEQALADYGIRNFADYAIDIRPSMNAGDSFGATRSFA